MNRAFSATPAEWLQQWRGSLVCVETSSRTEKWREQQQNISLLDFETLQKQKFSPN